MKYSEEELYTILNGFEIPKKNYTFQPLTDGFINDTFLVFDDKTPLFILQRVNHLVFTDVHSLMNNISHAFKHLKSDDYTEIILVNTHAGKNYYEQPEPKKGYWRMMTYIDGSTAYNTTNDAAIAFEAGRVVGKFNLLLQNANVTEYIDTIPQFHDVNLRKKQFREALKTADTAKITRATNAIEFAEKTLVKLKSMQIDNLPIRICHNDTKLNNILFSKKTQKALCLIDLDTLMKGYFHYDFGDAIRTIVNTAAEDEQDHSKITFEKNLFEAFVNGLAHNGSFLSAAEIAALPYGVLLMPFLHGIRALTDYLNNNIYYKVAYEEQNLDRCLSLFDFTQKAINEVPYMQQVTVNNLVSKGDQNF